MVLTPVQKDALEWIKERGGDGVIGYDTLHRDGVPLIKGERTPFKRETLDRLTAKGLVELYAVGEQVRFKIKERTT